MKCVILLHNYGLFDVEMSKIVDPHKYQIYLLTNEASKDKLIATHQQHFFSGIETPTDFTLETLISVIESIWMKSAASTLSIITLTDRAMQVCGRLRKYFGLEKENLDRYIDKIKMKQALKESDIRVPRHVRFSKEKYLTDSKRYLNELCQAIPFPLFIKPIDQASSIGVCKVTNQYELVKWAEANKNNVLEYEVDEFITGTLYHCDSYIKDGNILFTQVCEYYSPCFDFICGNPTGAITLSEDDLFEELKSFTKKVLTYLVPPQNGITHLEVFKTHDNECVFLEIAARPPGSFVPHLYEKHLGIFLKEDHIRLNIQDAFIPSIKKGPYSAFVNFPKKNGKVIQINYPDIKSSHEIFSKINLGDTLTQAKSLADVAMTIVLWNENYLDLKADLLAVKTFSPYVVQELGPVVN